MKKLYWSISLLAVVFLSSLAYASEMAFPASQIEKGGASLSIYYDHSYQKVNFETSGRDQISVGGLSYFSQVSNTLESNGTKNGVAAKLLVNPFAGWYYWVKAGVASYELEVPSVTVNNTYTTQDNGMNFGAGIRSVLFPDTLFTPAIALDVGVNYDAYDVNVFQQNGNRQKVATKLELTEVSAALTVSKIFKTFEPYGSVKVWRTYTRLSDKDTLESLSGSKDNAGIFVGSTIKVHPHESFILEGSFIGETSFVAGWNLSF